MTNLTTRQLSMDWTVQEISYRAVGRLQDPKLRKVESKIRKGTNQNDTPNHEHNPTHNAMFRKDYTIVVERLLTINPLLEDSFIKFRSGISYSEKLPASVDSIPEVHQQNCKEFVDRRLFRCQKMFLIQLWGIIL